MALSPTEIQAKLDAAVVAIEAATSTHSQMIRAHGADETKWPSSTKWAKFYANIQAARDAVGFLVVPSPPTADFSWVEEE